MEVLPGDVLPASQRYGPGTENGRALVAGRVEEHKNVVLISSNFKRYVPAARDLVIGVVHQRLADHYRVVLQPHSKPVKLDQLAFENATKKNKPNLVPGDVVYGRVLTTAPDLDDEIECYDSKTGKSTGLGQLKEGTVVNVRLGFARHLMYHGHPALDQLGKRQAFELAIGVNGRVWVQGPSPRATLEICRAIEEQDRLFIN